MNCCWETFFLVSSTKAPPEGRSRRPERTHLFVHEDVDDRVDHRAGLGQDGRDDAGLGRDQARRAEGGQQGHHAVRQPAQQVADDHHHHHEEHPLLALPAHRGVNAADLDTETGRGGLDERRSVAPRCVRRRGFLAFAAWRVPDLLLWGGNVGRRITLFMPGGYVPSVVTRFLPPWRNADSKWRWLASAWAEKNRHTPNPEGNHPVPT